MEPKELGNMRLKQLTISNVLIVIPIIIFFILISVFTITFAHIFFVLGVILLIQGVLGFIKGDSTRSIIPTFEKVAIYEKQKMGNEWYKQRKVGYVWQLILSSLLFLQSYLNQDSTDNGFQIEFMFMFIITFFILVMINISLVIHFRKVDHATKELDFKGYTWKSNLIAIAVGVVFALVMFVIALSYIISGM
ncbi:hypothetical protein [Bacillus seohaeanensis]|uniref:DUF3278 domain-containing protein n=1 Tax=Bacillus seohaeanensis TaxID=284580 RepID=A0ABW5RLI3_9BACI